MSWWVGLDPGARVAVALVAWMVLAVLVAVWADRAGRPYRRAGRHRARPRGR